MKISRLSVFILLIPFVVSSCVGKSPNKKLKNELARITVENSTSFDRQIETVEIPWAQIKKGQVEEVKVLTFPDKKEIPSQIIRTKEGQPEQLLFQVQMAKESKAQFRIIKGQPADYPSKTYARVVESRYNDFAWENDMIAYRVYNEALIPVDGPSGGVDVWNKSVRDLVIDRRYADKHYHTDHGEGADSYKVGPTLGAGGFGFVDKGELIQHSNYITADIQAAGPIRVQAVLTFPEILVNGEQISFTEKISFDAGQSLTQNTILFTEKVKDLNIATGIVKRDQGTVNYNDDLGYLSYWQGEIVSHGSTGLGMIVPLGAKKNTIANHEVFLKSFSGNNYCYYSGACWSKGNRNDSLNLAPDNEEDWIEYLALFASQLQQPLMIEIK